MAWPRHRCLLRAREGFSDAPYLIIYRGRAILILAGSLAKCHGGIKHCLPIGVADADQAAWYTMPLAIIIYAPSLLSRSSSSSPVRSVDLFSNRRIGRTWNEHTRLLNFAVLSLEPRVNQTMKLVEIHGCAAECSFSIVLYLARDRESIDAVFRVNNVRYCMSSLREIRRMMYVHGTYIGSSSTSNAKISWCLFFSVSHSFYFAFT